MESNTSPDRSNTPASAGERRLARLVVPAPPAYEPHERIDWIHDPLPPAPADGTADGVSGPHLPDA